MNIVFKGTKSNLKDFSLEENTARDIITYVYIVTSDSDCGDIKHQLSQDANFPTIGMQHPAVSGESEDTSVFAKMECKNISISQHSGDSSNEFVFYVDATFEYNSETDFITYDDAGYLFDYKRITNSYEVPFILAYKVHDPIDDDIITKHSPNVVALSYKYAPLRGSWLKDKEPSSGGVPPSGDDRNLNNSIPYLSVMNTVGGKLNAKTIDYKKSFSFSYYAKEFDSSFSDDYLGSTNIIDIAFEDITIPAYCGLVTKLEYSYVILNAKDDNGETRKKAVYKVDIEIEYYPKGVGQRLANLSTMYKEKAKTSSTGSIIGLQRIYSDNTKKYGTTICPNDVIDIIQGEVDYNKKSSFGAKEVILANMALDRQNSDITNDEYNKLIQQVTPIDEPVPISVEGRIATYYDETNDVEEYIMTYRDFLDARPMDWSPLGFKGRVTKEYNDFRKIQSGGE